MGLNLFNVAVSSTPPLCKAVYEHLHPARRTQIEKTSAARKEIKYSLSWVLIKNFLNHATHYSLESLQRFTNAHAPEPVPTWIKRTRVALASATLERAAQLLVHALGGPAECHRLVGGTEWWQMRLGEAKGEWLVERKRAKSSERLKTMLYVTGGGFYFGSIETHRFMLVRHCRLAHMRVFVVDYRKAPQYPFPCGLQDIIASYLHLVEPPQGSGQEPIPPSDIVLCGDSAGGGLILAMLQVLRDADIPMPAGATVISPWCSLTHSFGSVFENRQFDILPPYSFIHKPSLDWPPALEEYRQEYGDDEAPQLQFYAPNEILSHPLVSPVRADLTGFPPMLVICSNKECLRDESLYLAHKLDRGHLQVYDEACHILPVFAFAKVAKPCYAAIATFSKVVTRSLGPEDESSRARPGQAGTPDAYEQDRLLKGPLIRERVGIRGTVRDLEAPERIPALQVTDEDVAKVPPSIWHMAKEGRSVWAQRYSRTMRSLATHREQIERQQGGNAIAAPPDEHPPASAFAGRYDTSEARELARVYARKVPTANGFH